MLGRIKKVWKTLVGKSPAGDPARLLPREDGEDQSLAANLDTNLERLRAILGESLDLVYRKFRTGPGQGIRAAVLYLDPMVDKKRLEEFILRPLMVDARMVPLPGLTPGKALDRLKEKALAIGDVKEVSTLGGVVAGVLEGNTALLLAGETRALVAETRFWEGRAPEEPISEAAVRGPREGFTETLQTNIAMLRRRLKSSRLRLEHFTIGRVSRTDVVIAYLQGIAPCQVIEEVRQRLQRIDIDGILESGYIEELIEDHPSSIFSLVTRTERPDKVAAGLLSGRVAILTGNTPFVLLVPRLFIEGLQASEDYYERYLLTMGVRFFRYIALIISMLLPSLYVAVTTFHPEMLPTPLLLNIASQREGIPFPAVVEALLMEVTFEILREAGIRLPRQVGQTISIVGALVIGDAAVRAGIVSPVMVIVVSMTAIASFTTPAYDLAITVRMIRLPMIILAGVLGLYGIMAGILALLIHACSLKSFGVPFTSPFAPFVLGNMKMWWCGCPGGPCGTVPFP